MQETFKQFEKSGFLWLSFEVFIYLRHVTHDNLPVGSLVLTHLSYILWRNISLREKNFGVFKDPTSVVLIPTFSAASNAKLKFRFLSCGVSSS